MTCIIGRTGQGKSRSEGFIADLIREAIPFNEKDRYTNGIKLIKNPGSGEYLASQFLHEVPDPTAPPTTKGKPPMLRNPSVKALVRYPEMATMIGKSAGKGSIVQQTVIELYDVPAHIGGGSLTNGIYGADNPFGSVATTTQLKSIRNLVSADDASSGFLNRWLFIIGKTKTFQPFGKIIDVKPLVPDIKDLSNWSEAKYRSAQGWHQFQDDAATETARYLTEVVYPLQLDESEMLARAVLTFKKLVLLFSANMFEVKISLAAVEQAKIAFTYLIDCLRHIGVRITQTDSSELEEAILEEIRKRGDDGREDYEIRKTVKRKNPNWTTEIVNRMFKVLEESEMIEMRVVPRTSNVGRPKKRYFLVGGY